MQLVLIYCAVSLHHLQHTTPLYTPSERLTFCDNYEVPEPFDGTMTMDENAKDICVQWKLFPDKGLTSSESSLAL